MEKQIVSALRLCAAGLLPPPKRIVLSYADQLMTTVQRTAEGARVVWDILCLGGKFKKVALVQQEAEPMPGWHRAAGSDRLTELYPDVFFLTCEPA